MLVPGNINSALSRIWTVFIVGFAGVWYTHDTENSIADINEIESCVRTDDVFFDSEKEKKNKRGRRDETTACACVQGYLCGYSIFKTTDTWTDVMRR